MPTELLVVIATAGFVAIVAALSTRAPMRAGSGRSKLLGVGAIAVVVAGGQALEQAHIAKRTHGLWLAGAVIALLLGLAIIAQRQVPPNRNARYLFGAAAVVLVVIFVPQLLFGTDPTGLLY